MSQEIPPEYKQKIKPKNKHGFKFNNEKILISKKNDPDYLYKTFLRYLNKEKDKLDYITTNDYKDERIINIKESIIYKIFDITGKNTITPHQIEQSKLLYQTLIAFDNVCPIRGYYNSPSVKGYAHLGAEWQMLTKTWSKIMVVATGNEQDIIQLAKDYNFVNSWDDKYKYKYTNQSVCDESILEEIKKTNNDEYVVDNNVVESNVLIKNPLYNKQLASECIYELIYRELNQYSELTAKITEQRKGSFGFI